MKSRAQEKEPAQAVREEASEPRDIFDLVLSDKEPSFAHKRKLIRDASREDWQRLNMMGEMLFSTSLKARVISLYSAAEKEYHNPPALIEYAEGDDAELSPAALEALAYCRGERICDYAAERLIRCRTDVYAIKMLINNTDVTEGDILGLALTECKYAAWDTDTYHEICERIITTSEKNPKISRKSLIFAYESTPCSRCRLDALRELIRRKMADAEILRECLYDSDEDIRKLVKNLGQRA